MKKKSNSLRSLLGLFLLCATLLLASACSAGGTAGGTAGLDRNGARVAGSTQEVIYAYVTEINQQARTVTVDPVEVLGANDLDRLNQLSLSRDDLNDGYYLYNGSLARRMLPLADDIEFDFSHSSYFGSSAAGLASRVKQLVDLSSQITGDAQVLPDGTNGVRNDADGRNGLVNGASGNGATTNNGTNGNANGMVNGATTNNGANGNATMSNNGANGSANANSATSNNGAGNAAAPNGNSMNNSNGMAWNGYSQLQERLGADRHTIFRLILEDGSVTEISDVSALYH